MNRRELLKAITAIPAAVAAAACAKVLPERVPEEWDVADSLLVLHKGGCAVCNTNTSWTLKKKANGECWWECDECRCRLQRHPPRPFGTDPALLHHAGEQGVAQTEPTSAFYTNDAVWIAYRNGDWRRL
ncbi:MAG: hypothetical protein ACYS8L_07930 [Planctomycetota bacterium]|jgi:hypothetical protein